MINQIEYDTSPLIRAGFPIRITDQVILKESRTAVLKYGTVMTFNNTTKKWKPFTDEATEIPMGILLNELSVDDLKDDYQFGEILIGAGCTVDSDKVFIENSKTMDTLVAKAFGGTLTVAQTLATVGIFLEQDMYPHY